MADPDAQAGLGANGEQLSQPPPLHPAVMELLGRSEDSRQTQNQILQTLVQNMANQGGGGNPRHGYPTFLATEPPIFQGSKEPLDADFWLSAIEEKFGLFPCDDQEKVSFTAPREYGGKVTRLKLLKVIKSLGMNSAKFLEPIIFLLVLSLSRGKNFSS